MSVNLADLKRDIPGLIFIDSGFFNFKKAVLSNTTLCGMIKMYESGEILTNIWQGIVFPLGRLLVFVSLGILIGNFIEALNWTHKVARLARPLIRLARLSDDVGASFTAAFFSGVTANSMLAEAHDQGRISKQELVLANLLNSLPRFFLHLPTVFFLTAPLIKAAAFIYVGLTLCASLLQTLIVTLAGRFVFQPAGTRKGDMRIEEKERLSFRQAIHSTWKRFRKRFIRILRFVVPVYILFFLLNRFGLFDEIENFMVDHVPFLSFLHPKSLGIVVLHVTAEFSAGLAAAGALLDNDALGYRDIVLALLAGNILAAPIRAIRHQFPYYAGIFNPGLAMQLILYSQTFRVVTILTVTLVYYQLSS